MIAPGVGGNRARSTKASIRNSSSEAQKLAPTKGPSGKRGLDVPAAPASCAPLGLAGAQSRACTMSRVGADVSPLPGLLSRR